MTPTPFKPRSRLALIPIGSQPSRDSPTYSTLIGWWESRDPASLAQIGGAQRSPRPPFSLFSAATVTARSSLALFSISFSLSLSLSHISHFQVICHFFPFFLPFNYSPSPAPSLCWVRLEEEVKTKTYKTINNYVNFTTTRITFICKWKM